MRRSILASSAVPGSIPPVEINGGQLSDGGIICNVPVDCALAEGADAVIAVAVDRGITLGSKLETAVDIYVRAGEIQSFHLEEYHLNKADIVIRPELGAIHWTDFSRAQELVSLGEAATIEHLPEIRRLMKPTIRRRCVEGIKKFFVTQSSSSS